MGNVLMVLINIAVVGALGVGIFYVVRGAILSAEKKKRQL